MASEYHLSLISTEATQGRDNAYPVQLALAALESHFLNLPCYSSLQNSIHTRCMLSDMNHQFYTRNRHPSQTIQRRSRDLRSPRPPFPFSNVVSCRPVHRQAYHRRRLRTCLFGRWPTDVGYGTTSQVGDIMPQDGCTGLCPLVTWLSYGAGFCGISIFSGVGRVGDDVSP